MKNNIVKRIIGLILSGCLIVSQSTMAMASSNSVEYLTEEELESILDDAIYIAEEWEELGFTSEQLKDIFSMERNDAYDAEDFIEADCFSGADDFINAEDLGNADCLESIRNTEDFQSDDCTENILNTEDSESEILIQSDEKSSAYANGNPTKDAEEQKERISHAYSDAYTLYGDKDNVEDYVVYLYLSHYVDNPDYNKDNPNFEAIYADVITSADVAAYDNFIKGSQFSKNVDDVVHFCEGIYDIKSTGEDVVGAIKDIFSNGKLLTKNTVSAWRDIWQLLHDKKLKDLPDKCEEYYREANVTITDVLIKKYEEGASTEAIINEINETLGDEYDSDDMIYDYVDVCVTGLLGVLSTTPSLLGFGISMTVYWYDFYSKLMDRARLASL